MSDMPKPSGDGNILLGNETANTPGKVGRPRKPVSDTFFEKSPNETMILLAALKNELGTWEAVAERLSDAVLGTISASAIWKVAKGRMNSKRVERALGLERKRIRLAADVTEEQREALKKLASEFGCKSWSEFCRQTADHLNTGESFWIDFW
jgi:hypothetical protein